MSNFNEALEIVLAHEGGYVNNHIDRGGPTNMGITLKTLQAWNDKNKVTPTNLLEQLKELDKEDVSEIYKFFYWDYFGFDLFNDQPVCNLVFDMAVNLGVASTTKIIQKVLDLKVDGLYGPQTRFRLLQESNKLTDKTLRQNIIKQWQLKYISICQNDATQLAFLTGWIKRTHSHF